MRPAMLIDLSHPLQSDTPVYPGDPPVEILVVGTTQEEKPAGSRAMNVGRVSIGLHAGTHLDAPFHFFAEKPTIDAVLLERCVGPAVMLNLPDHGARAQITREDLSPHAEFMRSTGKVLVNTGWHRRWNQPDYFSAHPVLTGEAAQFLVDCAVHLVGVDFPSVDVAPYEAHEVLLGNEVLIVENLTNLDAVPTERFLFAALPLKIVGRDGSPVRAIALKMEEDSCLK